MMQELQLTTSVSGGRWPHIAHAVCTHNDATGACW